MSTSTNPPSSRGTAGVPVAGGNAKYIFVGVVLLMGMIAMAWCKFGSTSETPKPPVLPIAAATTPESKIDDIPPPPPAAETPTLDAGQAKPSARSMGPDPCAARNCGGNMTPELESALSVRAKQARRCYESELKSDPLLKGKIAMTVRIGSNGTVCSANITNSELPAISACVERVFRSSGGFPAPKSGCVEANVPMSFVPGR
jgi:hypothetical protein